MAQCQGGFRVVDVTIQSLDVKHSFVRNYWFAAIQLYNLEIKAPRQQIVSVDAIVKLQDALNLKISQASKKMEEFLVEINEVLAKHNIKTGAAYGAQFNDSIYIISANNKRFLELFLTADEIASGIDGLWIDGHLKDKVHSDLIVRLRGLVRHATRDIRTMHEQYTDAVNTVRNGSNKIVPAEGDDSARLAA